MEPRVHLAELDAALTTWTNSWAGGSATIDFVMTWVTKSWGQPTIRSFTRRPEKEWCAARRLAKHAPAMGRPKK